MSFDVEQILLTGISGNKWREGKGKASEDKRSGSKRGGECIPYNSASQAGRVVYQTRDRKADSASPFPFGISMGRPAQASKHASWWGLGLGWDAMGCDGMQRCVGCWGEGAEHGE